MTVVLYDKPECPFCYRVRLLLAARGVPYARHAFDDPEAERRWRALTPAATVPVFVDGDVVLTDSSVILEYLEDTVGGMLPAGAVPRARARTLLAYADAPIGRAVREVVFEKRAKPGGPWDDERLAKADAAWRACLPGLEARVDGDDFLTGEVYSFADAAMTGRFALAHAYGLALPPDDLPKVRAWWARRLTDPFFREASPPRVVAWRAA